MDKTDALNTLNEMPQKFELEELLERLVLLEKIERGREDVRQGNTVSHQNASKHLDKWLK